MADDIEVRVMAEADEAAVRALLSESFLREAPLCRALQYDIPRETDAWVHSVVRDSGTDGLSFVAVDRTTRGVVGVRLCAIKTRCKEPEALEPPVKSASVKYDKVVTFLRCLYEGVDIFTMYSVDEYVHLKVMSVRKEYTNRGIAGRLLDVAIEAARARGHKMFVVEVTGNYSRRVYEKRDYDVVRAILYDDYTDAQGERVFGDTGEHQVAKLMAKLYD